MTFDHRDEFSRKNIAEQIIKLLDAEMDFFPMAIDGGWGTGKTEFCHKLINLIADKDEHLRNQQKSVKDALYPKRAVIYLNAFAFESVDPLLCILAAIRAEFSDAETRDKICQKAVPVAAILCKATGKAIFAHFFKQDLEEVSKAVADAASESMNTLIDKTVGTLLDQYVDAQKNLNTLKDVIAKATAQRPILFFIDELDRCRPDFALSILELAKHVFDIPGIKFIFMVNLDQLKASIHKRYGQEIDADVYLEKFITTEIALSPQAKTTENIHNSIVLFEEYVNKYGLVKIKQEIIVRDFARSLIIKHNVSLRGVQRIIRTINIYMTVEKRNCFVCNSFSGYTIIVIMSVFMFVLNRKMCNDIMNNIIDIEKISNFASSYDENMNKIISVLFEMIDLGEKFCINSNSGNSDEKIDKLKILFNYIHVKTGNINARKFLIDTISILNLQPKN